jgi:hypothetical protein
MATVLDARGCMLSSRLCTSMTGVAYIQKVKNQLVFDSAWCKGEGRELIE